MTETKKILNPEESYTDFIGIYHNVYPEGFCNHLVEEFERHQGLGAGTDRQSSEKVKKHLKDDYQIYCNGKNFDFNTFRGNNPRNVFFDGLQNCFSKYSEEFSVLQGDRINANVMKMQKTGSGGGYHVWHGEQGYGLFANRGLVYSLYLNTLPEGSNGETEYLYQQLRIPPVENTMVIWPAAFTHAHRGNPVYGDAFKYIVTGWFVYE